MDPIANMLVMLRNAGAVKKPTVAVPYSNIKMAILNVLAKEGFILSASKKGKKVKKYIQCDLAYDGSGKSKISMTKRISKPSRRVYIKADEIKPVRQGMGLVVVSTPKGVITGNEARKLNVGGEILFTIY
jgi:small subunit ribosomal protein S8